ncbi:MAG: hypothetical protein KJ811_01470, partial [Candidatus Margulisbacteria bacterium]|nr:hypothetical protein [Candidatus Margulisiibacteriota bacterium]
LGGAVLEVDAIAEELREIGLGISEAQKAYLSSFGFKIIPRVWQEARLTAENIGAKVSALSDFETIIFDGEEILGYPADLEQVSAAMKKNKISYGYIEIVKQEGDSRLKKLMARDVVRVHSVPQKELKKISQGEAVKRFVRAAKERGVSLIYLRPFQPAQCGGPPIVYNLEYFTLVKESLEKSGFIIGQSEKVYPLMVAPWQLLLLAAGVLTGALLLLGYFLALPLALTYLLLLLSMVGTYFMINAGYITLVQKSLALLTTITFPTLAVISNLSKKAKVIFSIFDPITIILNIVGETMIGLFLLLGILADYRFMLGVETFAGVKFALLLPMVLVAVYFLLKSVRGNLIDHIKLIMAAKVSAAIVVSSLVFLGALFVLLARSGNFVLPVPAIEKYFREFLETAMFIRPRTKEFLIGYPALFIAAISFLRGRTQWLWLLAAAGTIAPISMINSFSHIHTPIMVSIARSINGLILGVIFGLIIGLLVDRLIMKSFWKTK